MQRIREGALKNNWSLADLTTNGRRIESASSSLLEFNNDNTTGHSDDHTGHIKTEPVYNVRTTQRQNHTNSCTYCGSGRCKGGKNCMAY